MNTEITYTEAEKMLTAQFESCRNRGLNFDEMCENLAGFTSALIKMDVTLKWTSSQFIQFIAFRSGLLKAYSIEQINKN